MKKEQLALMASCSFNIQKARVTTSFENNDVRIMSFIGWL